MRYPDRSSANRRFAGILGGLCLATGVSTYVFWPDGDRGVEAAQEVLVSPDWVQEPSDWTTLVPRRIITQQSDVCDEVDNTVPEALLPPEHLEDMSAEELDSLYEAGMLIDQATESRAMGPKLFNKLRELGLDVYVEDTEIEGMEGLTKGDFDLHMGIMYFDWEGEKVTLMPSTDVDVPRYDEDGSFIYDYQALYPGGISDGFMGNSIENLAIQIRDKYSY